MDAEDGRRGKGETGTGGQRNSVYKCKVQREGEATPQRTILKPDSKKKPFFPSTRRFYICQSWG